MANVTIKQVEGGHTSFPAMDDALELQTTANTSQYTYISELPSGLRLPMGTIWNAYIAPTISSNNLVVTLTGMGGTALSATKPAWFHSFSGGTKRVTSALAVTISAGTDTFNAGGAELATKEVDLFAYLGYNATDGVVIAVSRWPGATQYGDFSTTPTNAKYAAISTTTNAAATDEYHVIGRFAATLSAGAGYTWSVPTYTPANLIQRPIYETRWLEWAPQPSGKGSLTWTSPTVNVARYQITGPTLRWEASVAATLGGSASNSLYLTAPFQAAQRANAIAVGSGFAGPVTGTAWISSGTPDKIAVDRYDAANYATSGSLTLDVFGAYEI